MNDDRTHEDELTPAEQRLVALLMLLRAEAPRADARLTHAVMSAARWQLVLRAVFRAAGGFAAVAADAVAALVGIRTGPRGK